MTENSQPSTKECGSCWFWQGRCALGKKYKLASDDAHECQGYRRTGLGSDRRIVKNDKKELKWGIYL
jgi:hypothetical protein